MDAAVTPPELLSLYNNNNTPAPLIIDVRRDAAFLSAPDLIAGALRRDPEKIANWSGELPQATRIVVYCVHGHEVSQGAARTLREHGFQAQFLEGGIEAWRAAGGKLAANPDYTSRKQP